MLIPTIHPPPTPALKGRGTFLLPFFGGESPKKGLNIICGSAGIMERNSLEGVSPDD